MQKPDIPSFSDLLKERKIAEKYIEEVVAFLKQNNLWSWLIDQYEKISSTNDTHAYPDQGLQITPYDEQPDDLETKQLDDELIETTFHAWLYYLELFNHPDRLNALFKENKADFQPPQPSDNSLLDDKDNQIVGINEFSLTPTGAKKDRTKRTERFKNGPFVKLGCQARIPFVGSANPDIWGSTPAIASMVMSHALCGVPRDGFYSNPERQADLAKSVFNMLEKSPALHGKDPEVQVKLLEMWRHNVMGVLEANPQKAQERFTHLYEAGVRTFRIYSPEPGSGPLETLKILRKKEDLEPIEIFVGQVVDLEQAQDLETEGADGVYLGIGGGGRCTTGVRSGVGINWPQLVWEMRGQLNIPIIVEGGGSDYVAQSLSLGATGIGVTRAVGGGTIESPGGYLYFNDETGLWKPYRGEASAGMKSMGGRIGPYGIIPYVEGEGTRAYLEYGRGNVPTILQKLNLLLGDAIMGHVFQNVPSIEKLQEVGAKSLRLSGAGEMSLRQTH